MKLALSLAALLLLSPSSAISLNGPSQSGPNPNPPPPAAGAPPPPPQDNPAFDWLCQNEDDVLSEFDGEEFSPSDLFDALPDDVAAQTSIQQLDQAFFPQQGADLNLNPNNVDFCHPQGPPQGPPAPQH